MRRSKVAIGQAPRENCFSRLAVQVQALRLLVLFVPVEAQPAQPLKDRLHAGVGVALNVGIVQAQHHGPAVVASIEPIEDKGPGAAHMQKAGGRGRKANARSSGAGKSWNQASCSLVSTHDAIATLPGRAVFNVLLLRWELRWQLRRKRWRGYGGGYPNCGAGTTFHCAKAST